MQTKIIASVLRAAKVLEYLAQEGTGQIKDISAKTGLPKSTTHRILKTLEQARLTSSDTSGSYFLGSLALGLASSPILAHRYLTMCSLKEMLRLREISGETVNLHVLLGSQRLCLQEVPSPHDLRYTAGVGSTVPIYVGSAGKMLLAQLDDDEAEALIDTIDMKRVGPNTITDKRRLLKEVARARTSQYSTSFGERLVGSASISAPIKNYTMPACLSILGLKDRFTRMPEITKDMQRSAKKISDKLASNFPIRPMGDVGTNEMG